MSNAWKAKDRILGKLDSYIATVEDSASYADQLNRNCAYEVRDTIASFSRTKCFIIEKNVMKAEHYDPRADKWGFGPVKVHPVNYISFAK